MTESLPPRLTLPLNGQWQIEPGGAAKAPASWNHSVPVPALVDSAFPSYDWESSAYHWYRTTFQHHDIEHYSRVILRIDQAMFGTEVHVDGSFVGSDIACYTSQEYDIRPALQQTDDHELLLRIGAKRTLPRHSAVGNDQEKKTFIPGVWGDVALHCSGNPRISCVQVIPNIANATAEVRVTLDNTSEGQEVTVSTTIVELRSQAHASDQVMQRCMIAGGGETTTSSLIHLRDMRLWSPKSPFLYEAVVHVSVGGAGKDMYRATFGMRDFRIVGRGFYLNNQRIFLRGGNIALHRFFSDTDRGTLPWDPEWVRKLLIDIPRAHHFNFFRNHLGQLYNRWYDIADEYGMLIQNEWQFWTPSGTKEQIEKEFTRWLRDNWNHPSIILWDALNESSDPVVQGEVVPRMKELDPTRPWESVDVVEDHPYIYSLGPVLHGTKFGYSRSIAGIEHSPMPAVVNEFLWWWLDKDQRPTPFTQDVAERWLGRSYSQQELVDHQSFLATELVELFRRLQVDAIQPFVYLSNDAGPTANWFLGHIKDLQPKPVLKALKNAFAPVGLSLELWDRHFFPGEQRTSRLFFFNDTTEATEANVRFGVKGMDGEWMMSNQMTASLPASSTTCGVVTLEFPSAPGSYVAVAELQRADEEPVVSRKIAHVVSEPRTRLRDNTIVVLDQHREVCMYLTTQRIPFVEFEKVQLSGSGTLIIVGISMRDKGLQKRIREVSEFVRNGGSIVFQEPEQDAGDPETVSLLEGLDVSIEPRSDTDKGGYDSFVFAEDHAHPLWEGIAPEHLKFFNGALGGEIISQHSMTFGVTHRVLARCGLKLSVIAAAEIRYGSGLAVISRLQIRGRLTGPTDEKGLYARRVDPVAQRYLLNLLQYAASRQRGSNET